MVAHAYNSSTTETEAACLTSVWATQQDPAAKSKTESNDKTASSDTLRKRRHSRGEVCQAGHRLHIPGMLEGVL